MMRKILVVSVALLLATALLGFMIAGQWLWARVLGVLALILLLFNAWGRKSKGCSTVVWYLLFVIITIVILWLYPAGRVNDSTVALLCILGVILSVWEMYKEWQAMVQEKVEAKPKPEAAKCTKTITRHTNKEARENR